MSEVSDWNAHILSSTSSADEYARKREAEESALEIAFEAALDRLQRAVTCNTGCHLTADMVHALHISTFGEAIGEAS